MKRLYIIDLDGTVGLFHLFEALQDRMLLRPGLKEGLASMGNVRRVIATRAAPPYVEDVRKILTNHGIVFDAYYDVETVGLQGDGERDYFKHYGQILRDEGMGPEDQAVVIGDLMHFDPGDLYQMRRFRRFKFHRNPDRPIIRHSCCDHPTDPRILYVVVPQVMTCHRKNFLTVSFRAVIDHMERMWEKGEGCWSTGYQKMRRWDWRNDSLVSDVLMNKMAFQVGLGRPVLTRGGEDISHLFHDPAPHRYLFFKGRRRDWSPTKLIKGKLGSDIP